MLKRAAITASLVSALLVVGGGTTWAQGIWGNVICGEDPYAGCQLGSGQAPQQETAPPQHGPGPSGGGSNGSPAPQDPNAVRCGYVRSDYQPPAGGTMSAGYHLPSSRTPGTVMPAVYRPSTATANVLVAAQQPAPGQSGAWYVYQCTGNGWVEGVYHLPIWLPNGPGPGGAPSAAQLAQQAYNELRLPSPAIRANPAGPQLVTVPTWLWVDPARWGPQSATASVPGVSVTATATPTSVTWTLGDASTVTCPGAGTPFPPGTDPHASSPTCGHTYTQSSQGQPGNQFPVTATVHWAVTWAGAGQGGVFPDLTTTSAAAFTVLESQAVNSG